MNKALHKIETVNTKTSDCCAEVEGTRAPYGVTGCGGEIF